MSTSQKAVTPCGWRVKGQVWFMCGWQVKLCDPNVTHGPYLSALETGHNKALNTPSIYFFTFYVVIIIFVTTVT